MRSDDLYSLPKGLIVPVDDGECDHLEGMLLPELQLQTTGGREVDLSKLSGRTVLYLYPRTGRPDQEPPIGWNQIPGARGCTPQSCGFRDHKIDFEKLGVNVFGLSTQDNEYQLEAVERLHLPFELLSDKNLDFIKALNLPTFSIQEMVLSKRVTLILNEGCIEKVFYPVFPPDENVEKVISWLRELVA
jgi:peroxiredoxin